MKRSRVRAHAPRPVGIRAKGTSHHCPCDPQALPPAEVFAFGEGATPAAAIAAARDAAQFKLSDVRYAVSLAHRCAGSCVGTVILRWPEPSSYDAIVSVKKGPTGLITYRAFHAGVVSVWVTCERLSDPATNTLKGGPPNQPGPGAVVAWRLVPPGTAIP